MVVMFPTAWFPACMVYKACKSCIMSLVILCFIRKLLEDEEGGIFAVTLFKRAVCDFKAKAQENK